MLVGVIGWFVPQVLGVGYGFVGDALNGKMAFNLMLLLVVLKLLAVTTSYASGNAGGIFGPALFIGAMLGGTVGTAGPSFVPRLTPRRQAPTRWSGWARLRGDRPCSYDLGGDDLRDDAGLCRNRPADDR